MVESGRINEMAQLKVDRILRGKVWSFILERPTEHKSLGMRIMAANLCAMLDNSMRYCSCIMDFVSNRGDRYQGNVTTFFSDNVAVLLSDANGEPCPGGRPHAIMTAMVEGPLLQFRPR
jgi:hypothetical protein